VRVVDVDLFADARMSSSGLMTAVYTAATTGIASGTMSNAGNNGIGMFEESSSS